MLYFSGMTIHQLYNMEQLFQVDIDVFELFDRNARKDDNDKGIFDDVDEVTIRNDDDDDSDDDKRRDNERDPDRDTDKPADDRTRDTDLLSSCKLIRRSLCHFLETLNFNLFDKHYSYIFDIKKYFRSYKCSKCDSLWHNLWTLKQHERSRDSKIRRVLFWRNSSH